MKVNSVLKTIGNTLHIRVSSIMRWRSGLIAAVRTVSSMGRLLPG
jgi:hypothetical protein